MNQWINLDELSSWKKAAQMKGADLTKVMSGEEGARRVAKYTVPMAAGLSYNFAAKQVDDTILDSLYALAKEAQLAEKFAEL